MGVPAGVKTAEVKEGLGKAYTIRPLVAAEPTVEAIAADELATGPTAAERWILHEIQKMQSHSASAEAHRRRAVAGIAERFHSRLYRYCVGKLGQNRDEAEDVVQEVIQDIEPLLGRVESEVHLRNLIFRLAKNKCSDVVKDQRRLTLSNEIHADASTSDVETEEEDTAPLREAIKRLPKLEDRILLTLSLDYKMGLRQIAAILEISEGAAKMRRHRARQKLRALLEDDDD